LQSPDTHRQKAVPSFLCGIVAGLASAQLLSTLHVFYSNRLLHQKIAAIHAAGYLGIPNPQTLPSLKHLGSAIFGGLFYTLSLGAALALLTIGFLWAWHHLFARKRFVLIGGGAIWLLGLAGMNAGGFNLFGSLYFLCIPSATGLVYLRTLSDSYPKNRLSGGLITLIPLLLLIAVWSSQANRDLFINIRDYLLLSNPFGSAVNAFYYRYTLYPAESFKALDQKLLRTCRLEEIADEGVYRQLENRLRSRDYLRLPSTAPANLTITQTRETLVFFYHDKEILRTGIVDFLEDPEGDLKMFSQRTDRNGFLRQFTFFSILVAFPILLYCGVFALLQLGFAVFLSARAARIAAAAACLVIGLALFYPVFAGSQRAVSIDRLSSALASDDWRDRVAALRIIERRQLDIRKYPLYRRTLSSPHLPERYWVARALAFSHSPATRADLMKLFYDRENGVVSQALFALGKRGDREATSAIVTLIQLADDWYLQRYGYQSLRSLGWIQPASKHRP
jgi:hypothetical protein